MVSKLPILWKQALLSLTSLANDGMGASSGDDAELGGDGGALRGMITADKHYQQLVGAGVDALKVSCTTNHA